MQSTESDVESYRQDFIDRLRSIRNERRISARELSIALGQNVNYINLIENGKRLPSMQGFFAICAHFKLAPSAFFTPAAASTVATDAVTAVAALTDAQKESILSLIRTFCA